MSETKHTPYERKGRFIDNTDGANVAECRNANIAEFAVRACNAHDDLVAERNGLLAACELAALYMPCGEPSLGNGHVEPAGWADVIEELRAEIAKAKP